MKKDVFIKGMIFVLAGICLFAAAGLYPSLQTPLCGLGGVALGLGIALMVRAFRSPQPQPDNKRAYRGKNKKRKKR